jgi:molybdopterin-guanine dinucleotide biosynthesis protein A
MGRDKAELRIGGVAMAARVARAVQAAGCAPVRLVGGPVTRRQLGWDHIPDPDDGTGHPLWGIVAGLRASQTALALVAACDLVGVEAGDLRQMLAVGGPCVASGAGRDHPLLAVYPVSLAPLAARLAAQGAPAHHLSAGLPRVALSARATRNANHPSDLPAPPGPQR